MFISIKFKNCLSSVIYFLLSSLFFAGCITSPLNDPLFEASSKGDTKRLELILNLGADVNKKVVLQKGIDLTLQGGLQEYVGYTALTFAAEGGHLDTVKLLLDKGADVKQSSKFTLSRTSHRLYGHKRTSDESFGFGKEFNDRAEIVKLLLNKGAFVEPEAFINIVGSDYTELIKLFFEKGLVLNENESNRALIAAVHQGNNKEIVELLYTKYNLDPNFLDSYTALMYAANNNNTDIMTLLIEKGANVNFKNKLGDSALTIAVAGLSPNFYHHEPNIEAMRLLIEKGAQADSNILVALALKGEASDIKNFFKQGVQVDSKELDESLIFMARKGDSQGVKELLNKGANINALYRDGKTPLMYAAEFAAKGGSIEALKLLLSKGAKINIKDSEGETALSLAAGNPYNDLMNIEAVRLLIAKGVLLDKETFIRMAAKGYNNEVKLFLEKGIDINAQDKRIKRTALMEAAWRGQVETVKLLLNNKKIDVNISDQRGDTARSLAKSQHHLEIIKMLSSREEKNN